MSSFPLLVAAAIFGVPVTVIAEPSPCTLTISYPLICIGVSPAAVIEIVLDTVQNYDNFDIFGHIDYIIRYGIFKNKMYDFDTFRPIITEILKIIIRNNKGIEVNTSGFRYT
jgi:histidinol phosphatase-like PHP family hydrolase